MLLCCNIEIRFAIIEFMKRFIRSTYVNGFTLMGENICSGESNSRIPIPFPVNGASNTITDQSCIAKIQIVRNFEISGVYVCVCV